MQATPDIATNTPTISQEDAHHAVRDYVATHIDPAFAVSSSGYFYSNASARQIWRFVVYVADVADGFLDAVEVDAQTGEPIPLTQQQLDHIHERVQAFVASDSDSQPAAA